MNKLFLVLMMFVALLTTDAMAQKTVVKAPKVDLGVFPKAKEGYKRMHIQVPAIPNEMDCKVEIMVGKNEMVDCNNHFMAGTIQSEDLSGWGYTYYTAVTDGNIGSTMMACPDKKQTKKFVTMPSQMVNYNSNMPIVIYVPQNCDVKYRVWRADKTMQNAKK